jgi:uracil-DNA glycosylase
MQCTKCDLHKTRRSIVTGRGTIPADILMVGEAPGESEDALGKAFIGTSGKLLDQMIIKSGLSQFKIYITNCVRCHPPDNREPIGKEILACKDFLIKMFDMANPSVIILIGNVALRYHKKTFPSAYYIQHPAFLLRTGGIDSPYYLNNIRELEKVKEWLLKN